MGLRLSAALTLSFFLRRALKSSQRSLCSMMIVDTPGFQNPEMAGQSRGASFEELCHNYAQERLQTLFHERTFVQELERYKEVLLLGLGWPAMALLGEKDSGDKTWFPILEAAVPGLDLDCSGVDKSVPKSYVGTSSLTYLILFCTTF